MENTANRSVAVGKVTRVEICGCGGSLVVSLGAVSLKLDFEAAADVAATLDLALSRAARVRELEEERGPCTGARTEEQN